jgi:hypothetical protein
MKLLIMKSSPAPRHFLPLRSDTLYSGSLYRRHEFCLQGIEPGVVECRVSHRPNAPENSWQKLKSRTVQFRPIHHCVLVTRRQCQSSGTRRYRSLSFVSNSVYIYGSRSLWSECVCCCAIFRRYTARTSPRLSATLTWFYSRSATEFRDSILK